MTLSDFEIWMIILVIGIGTYLIRLSFLAFVSVEKFPAWALKLLRYAPVALIPGLVAPLVVWPAATGGAFDPARAMAAIVTLGVGLVTRSILAAIGAGAVTLYVSLSMI